jgi:hypothetical protein
MPVVVIGAPCSADVVDDDVLGPDRDLAMATGAAIELARDAPDQPGLMPLRGEAAKAGAGVG